LPLLADKDNHVIDALRYACEGARLAGQTRHKEYNYDASAALGMAA